MLDPDNATSHMARHSNNHTDQQGGANLATRATATGALGDIMVVEMVAAVAEELDEEQAEAEAEAGPSW